MWEGAVPVAEFVETNLSPALIEAGILCRAAVDHEGTPLIQFSPPLVFDRAEIDWLLSRVRTVLDDMNAIVR